MRSSRFLIVPILAALVSAATAQPVPPQPTANVVNFDDFPNAPTGIFPPLPVLDPNHYADLGVKISGFGQNGGAVADVSGAGINSTFPNVLVFVSIGMNQAGGLVSSPETLTFYPPVTSVQFDVSTADILDCMGTQIVKAEGFAPGGASLGSTTAAPTIDGIQTMSLNFPPPGAEKVVISSPSLCVTELGTFESFWLDTIAFVPAPQPASDCAGLAVKAAGTKVKAKAACYARAVLRGTPVDTKCLEQAEKHFTVAFTRATKQGDCLTDEDGPTLEAAVDEFVSGVLNAVNGGAPGPDVCDSREISAAGKNARAVTRCYTSPTRRGTAVPVDCITDTTRKLASSLKNCANEATVAALQDLSNTFARKIWRDIAVPSTTTTTTTTTSTTTTTAPPLGQHLSFTTTAGTANCGGASLGHQYTAPDAPFSGGIFSDTGATMSLSDLGLGCLYIGGGQAQVPASQIPENAASILNSDDGMTLTASFGTGPRDCSRGPEASRHCVNDPTVSCTTDVECAGLAGGCAADANCFFGPPVAVNGFVSSCVVNTFAADASGTVDTSTGASSVSIPLASRVYLTLGLPTACPQCVSGTCTYGANAGQPCTTTNSGLTTLDCLPSPGTFVATLPVSLNPLTTGSVTSTAADGLFCPGQNHAGAFGQPTAQAFSQTGSPAGDLTDGNPHSSTLVSNFCIPATGSPALDSLADLPGPGSLSLVGDAQFVTP